MNKIVECKDFRVPKIEANFEQLSKGQQNITIETKVSVMIPKDNEVKENIIDIVTTFSDNERNNIFKVKIQGNFKLVDGNIVSDEEKNKVLEEEAIPFLYNRLQVYIEKVLELSNIKFISLPPYKDL